MNTDPSPLHRVARNSVFRTEALLGAPFRIGPNRRAGGFSFVEVVIALGVVAFAFVALFGMLPVGLNAFNNSIDATIETQIAESVMSQLKQARFSQLSIYTDTTTGANTTPAGSPSFFKPYTQLYPSPTNGFFYDDQGNFLTVQATGFTSTTYTQTDLTNKTVYRAAVQVYYDTVSPSIGTPPFGTSPTNPTSALVSQTLNSSTQQPFATVVITVSKVSSPNVARIYTGYIENNGF
jgi:hypothetical protein